ncbi:outer membrane porin protein [Advenella kashmirensis WT001]|uniref:Outer membrane porin protein n=1 Tax=Advenella kashmirensis (strain DSM 17095 / LMG 22695 / WT001) TaxID=1036672 RepID=I3U943_ADVKW|nr:outer membrane porin protein [Advenella kashmirensis WT001]
MKKTLLAAALAVGFAGVAHAETSVTLYGIVDAGIGYQQTKVTQGDAFTKTRDIGLINGVRNGNRWGMKGVEDLGNGTSAIFQLESGFDLGNGRSAQGGRLFGRHAYVGLTGANWGTLTLGRQLNVAADTVSSLNPFGVATCRPVCFLVHSVLPLMPAWTIRSNISVLTFPASKLVSAMLAKTRKPPAATASKISKHVILPTGSRLVPLMITARFLSAFHTIASAQTCVCPMVQARRYNPYVESVWRL